MQATLEQHQELRERIKLAFRAFRKAGGFARMNVPGDTHSGPYEIVRKALSETDNERWAFTHYDRRRRGSYSLGSIFVAYGHTSDEDVNKVAVGKELRKLLRAQGILVRWNGSARKCLDARIRKPLKV